MRFLDSWIWLEYLFEGDKWQAAETAIENANVPDEGGILAATVIAKVSYRIRRTEDAETAESAIAAMREFEHIEVLAVTDEITENAAALRNKYYQRDDCELSYADAIHLAMAVVITECDTLYSGDPDFEDVDEIDTVIL